MQLHAKKLVWAAAGLFGVGTATGWSAPTVFRTARTADTAVEGLAVPAPTASPSSIPPGTAPDYRAIFAQNQAAVVSVTTEGQTKVADSQPFDFGNSPGDGSDNDGDSSGENPFSQFFRNAPRPPSSTIPTHALGSGFIISPDGLLLTNAHVVNGAQQVTVTLSDHRQFKAKVMGADRTSDIAVLKIDARSLPTVRLGNSDQLAVGDYVMAIGAPFGLEESATAGIVSAKGRSLPDDSYVPFIQIDAAVNPGNSGGPLFNATGTVVGINSQIYSNSGGYQGVAFAIPINLAEQVESQIVTTGKVEHGKLGVEIQNIDQSLADSFKLASPAGALVSKVEPDSAASHAGLQAGDVILKYNGATIADAGQLSMRVNTTAPGETATLQVWRDGKPLSLTATIGSGTRVSAVEQGGAPSEQTHLGLTLRALTQDEREQAGTTHGLVVEAAQGPAAEAGIQQGDVVLSVDGTPVQSVSQLGELLHRHDKQVALLIQRGDSRLYVPVTLG